MLEMKYTCDHCGKEIPLNAKGTDYNGYIEIRVDFRKTDANIGTTDLCYDCFDTLHEMIKKYLKGCDNNV